MAAIMWLGLSTLCAAVLSLAGVYLYLNPQIPSAESYRHVQLETPLRIYTADAQLIAEFGERRLIPLSLDQVPELFKRALLDTEDKRFYQHNGIDFISLSNDTFGLLKSVLFEGSLGPGASTITMQLARNVSFTLERKFLRKFKEMLLALKIEQELTKDEILELYINVVPFGKRAYGLQAASLTYYGKSIEELDLAQLAMLAGIPQAPSAGNPINGPERALRRRNAVLSRMLDQGSITVRQYQATIELPITARIHARELDVPAPFPAEWVRSQLLGRFPDLYSGGYEVVTTLRGNLQATARRALRKGLMNYDRRHGYRGPEARLGELSVEQYLQRLGNTAVYADLIPGVITAVSETEAQVLLADGQNIVMDLASVAWARSYLGVDERGPVPKSVSDVVQPGNLIRMQLMPSITTPEGQLVTQWRLAQLPEIQGALVSLNPLTGAVLALEGGFDFGMNQYNHALQAARQPGSGFKPFVYSAALHHGITPASIFMDAPLVWDDPLLESQYRPENDNNRFNGPTRLREAFYKSINLISMRVLLKVGAGNVMDYVSRFGFDTATFPRNTQLAIGGGTMAITPIDMAAVYSVFANGGWQVQPHILDKVLNLNGETLFQARYPQICDPCNVEEPSQDPLEEPKNLEDLLADNNDIDTEDTRDPEKDEDTPPIIPAVRVIDENNAYIMHTMLRDVVLKGTGRRARSLKRQDLAGKTGTTNDAADTWFNGYNPDVVTTVWVGFPNHQPLGSSHYGSNTPLPIWIDYMAVALAGRAERFPDQPDGVVAMKIDPVSGKLASPRQDNAIFEYFLNEHLPKSDIAHLPPDETTGEEIRPEDIF
ncbi:MAG: PBP1A family penicillin-binding protein [Gammaproteobacteria bacterium]|nr:PBP1A family penicillin-binding protein [Gammaproteobacteria bacterium]